MRMTLAVALMVLVSATPNAIASPASSRDVKVTGTYSNLEYNEEGGDVLGIEIKIVPAGGRLQGAVLVSEGEPATMVLVDVRVNGRSISFKVPAATNADHAWSFQGTISTKALKGTITYSSGMKEELTLPRRCGYWDR
jgi:hypothetical protein